MRVGFPGGGFRSTAIGSGFRGGGLRAAAIGPGFRSGFRFPWSCCQHGRSRRRLPWRWLGLVQRLGVRRISVRRNSWLLRLLLALGWLRVGSISVISRITDTRLIPTLGTRVTGEHVSVPSNAPVLGCNRQRWSSASPPTDKAGGLTPSECLGDEPTFRRAYRRRFRRFGLSILEGNFRRHGRPYVSCLTTAASADRA